MASVRSCDGPECEDDLGRTRVFLSQHAGHRGCDVVLLVEDRHHVRDAGHRAVRFDHAAEAIGRGSAPVWYAWLMASTPLTERPAWQALRGQYEALRNVHLRDLFADDPGRAERFSADAVGIHLDYSKNRIRHETMRTLLDLAEQSGLRERIDAMFAGEKINITEDRAVLHVALRAPKNKTITVDGVDVVPAVHEVLGRMGEFADKVREGRWKGHTGEPITQHRQHRHRRVGPRSGHGVRGAAALLRPRPDVPVRVQCRRHGLRGGDARPRPGPHPVHRVVQDVHDARDDDECRHGARLDPVGRRR